MSIFFLGWSVTVVLACNMSTWFAFVFSGLCDAATSVTCCCAFVMEVQAETNQAGDLQVQSSD